MKPAEKPTATRRVNWPVIIPAILFIYLLLMMKLGWPSYKAGLTSPLLYFGGSALVAVCIVLLHFHLKRRAALQAQKRRDRS